MHCIMCIHFSYFVVLNCSELSNFNLSQTVAKVKASEENILVVLSVLCKSVTLQLEVNHVTTTE